MHEDLKQAMPEDHKEGIRRIKDMAKKYKDAKTRVMVYPKKRPTLMKQLRVSLDEYGSCGVVGYDEELFKQMPLEDQDYIRQYVADMELIFVLEKGIAAISNEKTRMIAEDTLLKGKSCKELETKYGMKGHTICVRRSHAIKELSLLL